MDKHGRGEVVAHVVHCVCGAAGARDEVWDAYACPVSGVWLESGCKDSGCEFCAERPETRETAP